MKIGLALSGGGMKGIAHAGVLQALEENNINIDIIGGTSSGGIVASLYAIGYSPAEILSIFKTYSKDISKVKSRNFISGLGAVFGKKKSKFIGFKTGESIEQSYLEIEKINGIKKITDIKMPLVIPAVDIGEAEEYIFTNYIPKDNLENTKYITDISVGKAVRASSSFPAIFCPCEYQNHKFLDGGILDNVPVNEVKKQGANKVIAVNFDTEKIDENSDIMDIAMHTIDIMGSRISEEGINLSDYILTIKTDKVGLLDNKNLEKCFRYGYNEVNKNIEKIKLAIK